MFKSNRTEFNRKNDSLKEMVMGRMAMDVERALKLTSGMPVKTGAMKSGTRHFRSPKGGFRVEIDKEYAAYQEAGARSDGTHVVRNYTTGGTGKGFFRKAINSVIRNRENYIKESRRALGL